MARIKKPVITVRCVANSYSAEGERIIEVSHPAKNGAGCLISVKVNGEELVVELYRCSNVECHCQKGANKSLGIPYKLQTKLLPTAVTGSKCLSCRNWWAQSSCEMKEALVLFAATLDDYDGTMEEFEATHPGEYESSSIDLAEINEKTGAVVWCPLYASKRGNDDEEAY